jgi:hypothetical protein
MRTWYIVNKADDGTPKSLSIMDDIGAYGVSAKSFLNDLKAVRGDTVDIEINSPGGDVFAGLAIVPDRKVMYMAPPKRDLRGGICPVTGHLPAHHGSTGDVCRDQSRSDPWPDYGT